MAGPTLPDTSVQHKIVGPTHELTIEEKKRADDAIVRKLALIQEKNKSEHSPPPDSDFDSQLFFPPPGWRPRAPKESTRQYRTAYVLFCMAWADAKKNDWPLSSENFKKPGELWSVYGSNHRFVWKMAEDGKWDKFDEECWNSTAWRDKLSPLMGAMPLGPWAKTHHPSATPPLQLAPAAIKDELTTMDLAPSPLIVGPSSSSLQVSTAPRFKSRGLKPKAKAIDTVRSSVLGMETPAFDLKGKRKASILEESMPPASSRCVQSTAEAGPSTVRDLPGWQGLTGVGMAAEDATWKPDLPPDEVSPRRPRKKKRRHPPSGTPELISTPSSVASALSDLPTTPPPNFIPAWMSTDASRRDLIENPTCQPPNLSLYEPIDWGEVHAEQETARFGETSFGEHWALTPVKFKVNWNMIVNYNANTSPAPPEVVVEGDE